MRRSPIAIALIWLPLALHAAPTIDRTEIRLPDLPGYVTLKCDLHLHTVFSDGDVWPPVRVIEAWRDGLDAIALTDHIEYQPKTNDVPTQHHRPYELAAGTARERGILLIRGAEITKSAETGHYNAIFLTNIYEVAHDDVRESVRRAAAQGAFVFWNHPGWKVPPDQPIVRPHHEEMVASNWLHGIELWNDGTAYTNVWPWAMKTKLAWLGNSDYHRPIDPPLPNHANHRTLTIVLARERSLTGLREALFEGRTLIWNENLLVGRREWLEPFVAACLQVDPPHHRDAKNLAFHLRNLSDIPFELVRIEGPGPERLSVPAGRVVLVKIPVPAATTARLVYAATNAWWAPGEFAQLTWTVDARKP
ncbi:MAG: Sb-PDE family phosphodiesterase [Kiritimatiellae bacterium]|nr:Sb-PDE family phosphodiesterase [Kiritimatiellia bacterium]